MSFWVHLKYSLYPEQCVFIFRLFNQNQLHYILQEKEHQLEMAK